MSSSIERYPRAFNISQKILNSCKCSFYPVDIERIIRTWTIEHIIIISESDYKRFRIETKQKRPYISIKDGRTYYDPKRDLYIIVYNDSKCENRIRFTLAHEFAHIVLGHLSDIRTEMERGGLSDSVYYAYEGAANTFAGNFLAPPIIISEKIGKNIFCSSFIASVFKISEKAVREYRKDDFEYWKKLTPTSDELNILERYQQRLNSFFCKTCSSIFAIKNAKYCPVCGTQAALLKLGGEEIMGCTYPHIELNENGRVKECPICGNEEHLEDSIFCMICGKPSVNRCTFAISKDYDDGGCEHCEPLPGNARYCPYCGNKTTFLEANLLQEWNIASQKERNIVSQKIQDFSEYDSENDQELPF